MTKEQVFDILDAHKGSRYENHSDLIPVLDYMQEHDTAGYESLRRVLNKVYLTLGAEIASEIRNKRQLKINFDETKN